MSAAIANLSCDQANSARAALTCLIDTFSIDSRGIIHDTFSIEMGRGTEDQRCLTHLSRQSTIPTAAIS